MTDFNVAAGIQPPQGLNLAPLAQLAQVQYSQAHSDLVRAQAEKQQRILNYGSQYIDAVQKGDTSGAQRALVNIGDPTTANALLENTQKQGTYDAQRQFGAGASMGDQNSTAQIGRWSPQAAVQYSEIQKNAATAIKTYGESAANKISLGGRVANMIIGGVRPDGTIDPNAREAAIQTARNSGIIQSDLQAEQWRNMPPQQLLPVAKAWQDAGQSADDYLKNTGTAAGRIAAAESPFKFTTRSPEQNVYSNAQLAGLPGSGAVNSPQPNTFGAPSSGVMTGAPPAMPRPQPQPQAAAPGAAGPAPAPAPAPGPAQPPVMPGGPTAPPSGASPVAPGMSPFQVKTQQSRAEALDKEYTEMGGSAKESRDQNALLDQMRTESASWPMGAGSSTMMKMATYLQPVAKSLGMSHQLDQSVGDWQAFNKNAGNLVRMAVRETSSRAAVQEYLMIQNTLPSGDMSREGFTHIADQLQGVHDYNIAKYQAAARWRQAYGSTDGFEAEWNKNVTPTIFMLHRMSDADAKTVADTLSKSPKGQQLMGQIARTNQYARDYGLFGDI